MTKCGYCGSTIFMGGVRDGAQRFCNKKCHQSGLILRAAQQVPPGEVDRQVEEVFRGNCPKCRGLGPVDVHKVHRVWSALVLTSWKSWQQVSCRSCGTKAQLGGALFSAVFGWWGFPWGLVLTPVQITRNILGMCKGPDPSRPSEALKRFVQVNLGLQLTQRSRLNQHSKPPPIPH